MEQTESRRTPRPVALHPTRRFSTGFTCGCVRNRKVALFKFGQNPLIYNPVSCLAHGAGLLALGLAAEQGDYVTANRNHGTITALSTNALLYFRVTLLLLSSGIPNSIESATCGQTASYK